MLGAYPLAEFALEEIDDADLIVIVGPLDLLLADANAALVLLLEVSPGTEGDPTGVLVTLSDRGFISEPGDTPPNIAYLPRLSVPMNYEVQLPLPDAGESLGSIGFGAIEILNQDGRFTNETLKSWEGREALIKIVGTFNVGRWNEATLALSDAGIALRATVDHVAQENGIISLSLREGLSARLDAELQTSRYLGTGGDEGPASLEGRPKPLCFGAPENVAPVLIDPVLLIYQIHERSMQAIQFVRDGGILLVALGERVPLSSWTPVASSFVTDLATGKFRLGSPPEGLVTSDPKGDNVGGYVDDTQRIVRRALAWKAGIDDPDELDLPSFTGFSSTAIVGVFLDDDTSAIDFLSGMLAACDAWGVPTREAWYRIGSFVAPENASPVVDLDDSTLSNITEQTGAAPAYRVKIGYRPMSTVQDPDGLLGAVDPEMRQLYSNKLRYSVAEDLGVKTLHRSAREVTLDTLMASKMDADTLAASLLARLKVRRNIYRARNEGTLFKLKAGDVVRVTSSDANLSSGKQLWIASIAEIPHDGSIELELWG